MEKRPLSSLDGKRVDGYVLHLDNLSLGRFAEETNFELYLTTEGGERSEQPIVKGTYFSGRGEFYKPWLEIYYRSSVKLNDATTVEPSKSGLGEKLFEHLAKLLPAGGHIMVPYLDHEETREALQKGVPPEATPLGYLLWKAGCTSFKDWYFAEGFWEGDIKLQGNKPPDEKTKRDDLLEIRKELTGFLEDEKRKENFFREARKRAEAVLEDIRTELPER